MQAAVYLRQSRDQNGDELAVGRQRADCLALCERRGWTPVEFVDNDTSASNGKRRRAYEQMLADIRGGSIGAVVCWHLDRLHRQPSELEDFMKLADRHHVALASVTGDIDLATDDGRFMARILGAVARKEVDRKIARQQRASKQLAEEDGRPWWPSRPFGYDADPGPDGKWTSKGQIRKHPTEAKLVVAAYRTFLAGSSLRSIAAKWNDKGITSPKGNPWSGTQVRALLLSERNAGLRALRGEIVGKGSWPALISEETWRQAVHKLADTSRRNGGTRERKYLLSGITLCGRCGAGLGSAVSSRGQRQYACNKCQKIARDGEHLDQLVIRTVVRRLAEPDAIKLLQPPAANNTEGLRERRAALKDRLAQLGKEFAAAPPEFTQAALSTINAELAEIDAKLFDPDQARIFEGVVGVDDVEKAFAGLDLGRQRTIVNALLTVTVNPVTRMSGKKFRAQDIDVVWK